MPFSFEETPNSRAATTVPPAYTLIYNAVGEQDDAVVHAYALNATPALVSRPTGTLYRKDVRIDVVGWAHYLVTVPYGQLDPSNTPAGSATFNFSTRGATVKIKAAKEHIATYESSGVVAGDFHKGAIGVKRNSDGTQEAEGSDIIISALRLTYSFRHPAAIVTESFARLLSTVTGMTNSATFRGFAAGELLYAGSDGSDGTDAEATVDYEFIASGNTTSLSIGDIANIVKQGHHIAWVEFEDNVDSGEAVHRPKRVHIERPYDSFNFATVFGWS